MSMIELLSKCGAISIINRPGASKQQGYSTAVNDYGYYRLKVLLLLMLMEGEGVIVNTPSNYHDIIFATNRK